MTAADDSRRQPARLRLIERARRARGVRVFEGATVSFICRMVVGYFDPDKAYARNIEIERPLDHETVHRLQTACDELFPIELRLAEYLTEQGVLVIVDGVITRDMFRIACVAHELFGMVAVDNAHQGEVYPRPDWEPQSLDSLMEEAREFRSDWDEAELRQDAEFMREWQLQVAEFERGVIERVRAAKSLRAVASKGAIVIVDYDPAWPAQFASLAAAVSAALGPVLVLIEHVGSTAVPGLSAKPIIDLDAVVRLAEMPEAIGRLAAAGYTHLGERGVPGREAFAAPVGTLPHHLYLCPVGSPALAEHIRFRDVLRADGRLANEYGGLKRAFAQRFGYDRDGYTAAKTEFIRAALAMPEARDHAVN